MKKVLRTFAVCAVMFSVFGCMNVLDSSSDENFVNKNFGSLSVCEDTSGRKLDIPSIKYASLTVSGTGIKEEDEPFVNVAVVDGKASGISIKNVPVGKNRIVTVQAKDETKKKIGTVTMRNICDIKAGENSVYIDWSTTAIGNVFYSLHSLGHDVSSVSASDTEKIKKLISSINVHACLVDSNKIARDFMQGEFSVPSDYAFQTAGLKFSAILDGGYTVQVCDPLSEPKVFSSSEGFVDGIAPGLWRVYFIQGGKVVKSKEVVFESGKVNDIGTVGAVLNKIILHVEKYTTIWAWSKEPAKNFTGGVWPGVEMEKDSRDGWYKYELPVEAENVIFSNKGSGQTSNLILPGAGEWWYSKALWHDDDPADFVSPEITGIECGADGTVSGEVIITITATDNKMLSKAQIYIDDKNPVDVSMTGQIDTVTYRWNSAFVKNGTHELKVKVLDKSGNVSEEKILVLTTSNSNIAPIAVISGSVNVGLGKIKKFSGKSSYDPNGEIKAFSWKVSGGANIKNGQGTSEIEVEFPKIKTTCDIILTVTDDDGEESSETKTVAVQDLISTDFREETIYFAMTTRFFDGDSSNNVHCWDENEETPADDPAWRGDFKGLIEKLDYIKALGFSAVWITPVVENCSGLDYHGYHAMNFSKVDPRYESSGVDFQKLIDEVHSRGMKLVLDVVFNHVGNFGETNLCPMFEKDYSADLADINACLKFCKDSELEKQFPSYWDMKPADQYGSRLALMKNTDYQNHDYRNYFHHFGFGNWDNFSVQFFQMAGDCVDLNTENPKVLKYIGDAYSKYIEMGVDAFRIDTGKHLSRLEFNYYLNDRFKETAAACGNENFYMFTEICAKSSDVTYRGNVENLSPYFYTWKDDDNYGFTMDDEDQFEGVIIYPESTETEKDEQAVLKNLDYWTRPTKDGGTKTPVNALAVQKQGMATTEVRSNRPESKNHLLEGNDYHEPDYSRHSGLDVIDFPMHWNFGSANDAYSVRGGDKYYNDATWNVVYVDSHDYGPGDQFEHRYQKNDDCWAENMDLMFTFRGIPCIYYGSEVAFMRGAIIDKGPIMPLNETGRAYFGDHIEGSVKTTDFSEWSDATGAMAETLNHPLARHLQRLNRIRREIPALQKGQYSDKDCGSNGIAFKRRYTKGGTDSFVLVTISGDTEFTNIPAGTYVDAITGDTKVVSAGGSLSTSGCTGQGNMRVYVLNGSGKIGEDTEWLK